MTTTTENPAEDVAPGADTAGIPAGEIPMQNLPSDPLILEPMTKQVPLANAQDGNDAAKKLDEAAVDLLLGINQVIDMMKGVGITIYDVTLASLAMLRKVKSPLIEGVRIADIENIELEVAKFLAIHTVDLMDDDALAELNEQARDPVVFELVAMKFARCVYGRLMQWLNFVLDLIEQSNTTEMRYVPEPRRNTGTNELSDIHYALLPKV